MESLQSVDVTYGRSREPVYLPLTTSVVTIEPGKDNDQSSNLMPVKTEHLNSVDGPDSQAVALDANDGQNSSFVKSIEDVRICSLLSCIYVLLLHDS